MSSVWRANVYGIQLFLAKEGPVVEPIVEFAEFLLALIQNSWRVVCHSEKFYIASRPRKVNNFPDYFPSPVTCPYDCDLRWSHLCNSSSEFESFGLVFFIPSLVLNSFSESLANDLDLFFLHVGMKWQTEHFSGE